MSESLDADTLEREDAGAERVMIVLCTVPTEKLGLDIGRALVEERLAACVNLVPAVTSIYHWEGRVQEDAEVLMILKTREGRLDLLTTSLRELHPYDVPEILATPVTAGSAAYLRWVREETGG